MNREEKDWRCSTRLKREAMQKGRMVEVRRKRKEERWRCLKPPSLLLSPRGLVGERWIREGVAPPN
jgi:hypothetical protein